MTKEHDEEYQWWYDKAVTYLHAFQMQLVIERAGLLPPDDAMSDMIAQTEHVFVVR